MSLGIRELKNITIPSNVQNPIGLRAFISNYSLESIVLPASIPSIGAYAFQSCYALRNVVIPAGVTAIYTYILNTCLSLATIKILGSVTTVGAYAFASCPLLKVIDLRYCTTVPTLSNTNAISNNTGLQIIVPDDLYDTWKAATNWTTYSSKIIKASDYDAGLNQ